ncbi:MAG TPA: phosphate ABC transporter permease PstA [Thermomicrobiales bacterium]|nr:phosphate ABC transporter permease PstA [Thermomicrobiales bacterium]
MSASTTRFNDAQLRRRKLIGNIALGLFILATLSALAVLAVLVGDTLRDGLGWLDWDFIRNLPSRRPERAGIWPALAGTVWIMILTAAFTFPIGVGAAIYLEEFGGKGRLARIIEINIANLAGVPSIVYGLLGLAVFVELSQLGPSVLAGALTMTLLVLPVVIIASREAIRAVPDSLRQASLGLGATRLQTVWSHVLPAAMPGILTGTILALSRAIGETAPLIVVGAATYITYTPEGPTDRFTVLPMQIFEWISRPQAAFHALAAAGIIVLLALLLTMNLAAILLRNYFRKNQNW